MHYTVNVVSRIYCTYISCLLNVYKYFCLRNVVIQFITMSYSITEEKNECNNVNYIIYYIFK